MATTASIKTRRTVDELLLRKRQEFSCFGKPRTLEGTNGGERPASTAMLLILNRGNTTFLYPVDVLGKIRIVKDFKVLLTVLT